MLQFPICAESSYLSGWARGGTIFLEHLLKEKLKKTTLMMLKNFKYSFRYLYFSHFAYKIFKLSQEIEHKSLIR